MLHGRRPARAHQRPRRRSADRCAASAHVTLKLLPRDDVPVPADAADHARRRAGRSTTPSCVAPCWPRRPAGVGAAAAGRGGRGRAASGARMVAGRRRRRRGSSGCCATAMDTALTAIGRARRMPTPSPSPPSWSRPNSSRRGSCCTRSSTATCCSLPTASPTLATTPRDKVFTLLETGSRAALNALLARCGLGEAVRNLVARLIFHARAADLADDATARHFVVTALTEELIVEHEGRHPARARGRLRLPQRAERRSRPPRRPRRDVRLRRRRRGRSATCRCIDDGRAPGAAGGLASVAELLAQHALLEPGARIEQQRHLVARGSRAPPPRPHS